jgi:hypothetical protein
MMGEVKRRNRGAVHPSLPTEEAMRDTVFFEHLIQREIKKALGPVRAGRRQQASTR